MGFEPVKVPQRGEFFRPLAEGEVSIQRNGTALFNLEDLALVNIGDCAALLVDGGVLRVGLRSPRSQDTESVVRVTAVKRAGKVVRGKMVVNLAPALRTLGLTFAATRGRYELTTKDDLLIVNLGKAKAGAEGKRG